MNIQIGKKYKARNGQVFTITKGSPLVGERTVTDFHSMWNGIFWGSSDTVFNERFLYDGRHWSYWAAGNIFGFEEFNVPDYDLIEEVLTK